MPLRRIMARFRPRWASLRRKLLFQARRAREGLAPCAAPRPGGARLPRPAFSTTSLASLPAGCGVLATTAAGFGAAKERSLARSSRTRRQTAV